VGDIKENDTLEVIEDRSEGLEAANRLRLNLKVWWMKVRRQKSPV
jgi:hypothetical protein